MGFETSIEMNYPRYNKILINGQTFQESSLNSLCLRKLSDETLPDWEKNLYKLILNWISTEPFFEVKTSGRSFINLEDESSLKEFARSFPDDVVSLVDGEENPSEHIYRLHDDILIKEQTWQ